TTSARSSANRPCGVRTAELAASTAGAAWEDVAHESSIKSIKIDMKPLEDAPDEHRRPPARSLASLLDELPAGEDDAVVHTEQAALTRGDLHTAIRGVAQALRESGVGAGTPIGALVSTGPAGLVCMMAAWEVGATYVPL